MQQIAENENERNEVLCAYKEAEKSSDKTYSELMLIIKDR